MQEVMMTNQGNIREEIQAQWIYSRLMLYGTLSLTKMLVTNARDVAKLRLTKTFEEHYVRPERLYDLPEYQPGMQVNLSKEKYLRPTRLCDCRAPEIVAMANSMGAFQKTNEAYAQDVFSFVKERLLLEILPIDGVVETMQRGTGTCFQLISVFIALCRAAGIPARYKMFAMNMIAAWQDVLVEADPLVKRWYNALGYFMIEGEGEIYLNGRWTVAHVGPTAERQAAGGLPITRLGEDAIGLWFIARPGTIMRFEAMPAGIIAGSRLLQRIAPGSMERVNLSVMRQTEQGQAVLAAAGGAEAYDTAIRSKLMPKGPQVDLSAREEIVFEGR
jgi:hypothetical protein